jgi:hypothetical protein
MYFTQGLILVLCAIVISNGTSRTKSTVTLGDETKLGIIHIAESSFPFTPENIMIFDAPIDVKERILGRSTLNLIGAYVPRSPHWLRMFLAEDLRTTELSGGERF